MILDNDTWLELTEISTDLLDGLRTTTSHQVGSPPTSSASVTINKTVHHNHAIHLFLDLTATTNTEAIPQTSGEESDKSVSCAHHQHYQLTSVILDAVECPSLRKGWMLLHPLLWEYLDSAADMAIQAHSTTTTTNENPVGQAPTLLQEEKEHDTSSRSSSIPARIAPLPIEPLDPDVMAAAQMATKNPYPWRIRPVPIQLVGDEDHKVLIDISCIYLDPDILTQMQTQRIDDDDFLESLISSAWQGRLILPDSIAILNTMYGVAIVLVSSVVVEGGGSTSHDIHQDKEQQQQQQQQQDEKLQPSRGRNQATALRLGAAIWHKVKISNKQDFLDTSNNNHFHDPNPQWEPKIPGYESLLQELLTILQLKYHNNDNETGSTIAASPTGILLTGCAGVGKSTLASCVAHNLSINSTTSQWRELRAVTPPTIHWVSTQELLFLASTETDLVETVLLPPSTCDLWVIDDLHLLARESQDGEEDEGAGGGRDVEYMLVLNSILQTIDQLVVGESRSSGGGGSRSHCNILGIGQVAVRLPPALTKMGRLEKEVTMLPPTQSQRTIIWESILPSEQLPSVELQHQWSLALASATAGCVPSDLLRVYQDACTRAWARHTSVGGTNRSLAVMTTLSSSTTVIDRSSSPPMLQWTDLSEAAHLCIPSQLAELDVTKPSMPIETGAMNWEEVHAISWKAFGGYGIIKQRVFRHVVAPWRRFLRKLDQESSERLVTSGTITSSSSLGIDPPPGVLFHGPSGCGKSLAATCLAASLDLPVIQVRATDILDKWLGGSEALLRSLFARARAAAPCILFLDEIDSIAVNRAEDDTSDVASRVLSTLLNELDGVSSGARQSRVLVVACTNRLNALDAALLRPGRLEEHLCLDLPTVIDLLEILKLRVSSMPLDKSVLLLDLAQAFYDRGATGADVEGVCRDVCLAALRASSDPDQLALSQDDFLQVIYKLQHTG